MLQVASALEGCTLEVNDGAIGTVDDLLFDDSTWRMRWLIVNVGSWLTGRKVLVHPSAVVETDAYQGTVRLDLEHLSITLTECLCILRGAGNWRTPAC
jgi:hypothetical protein